VRRLSDHDVVLWVGMLTLADFGRRLGFAVTLAPLVTVTVAAVIITVADILHLAVAVGTPGAVAIAAVIVALTSVIFTGRKGFAVAARRGAATAGRALTTTTATATLAALRALATGAVAARIEAPGCRGRGACPLHLIC
jgi:hypothetical protein